MRVCSERYHVGTAEESVEFCKNKGQKFNDILINGGEEYDFITKKFSSKFSSISHQDQKDYLNYISKQKSIFDDDFINEKLEKFFPHNDFGNEIFLIGKSFQQNLQRLLKKARKNQMKWQDKMNIKSSKAFYIDVGHEALYRMSLSDDSVELVKESEIKDDNYEIFRCSYSLFIALLTGHFNYSNMKTGLMSFYRKPDIFDPQIHTLMSYLQV